MQTMSTVKKSIITAVCIALCYVLPLLFHGIQGAGQIFCPMHIPVFLCGLVCGWQFGLLCGLAGPALSSALCGMPPVSILPSMMIELAVYGLIAGLMMRCVRTRHVYADLYISLIVAIIAGRVVNGLVNALIFARGKVAQLYFHRGVALGADADDAVVPRRDLGAGLKIDGGGEHTAVLMIGVVAADLGSAGGGEVKCRAHISSNILQ